MVPDPMHPAEGAVEATPAVGSASPLVRGATAARVVALLGAVVLVVLAFVPGTSVPSPVGPISFAGPVDEGELHLAVAGDVGTGDQAAHRTAAVIDRYEVEDPYDALVLLGDNVYPDGDPKELGRTVFDPFAGVLDGETSLLAVLGNHDVDDGYAAEHAATIGMPDRWYATTIGNTLIIGLDSNQPENPDQREWLAETLRSSDARWKIAAMHHPPYSGGSHGSSLDVRSAFSPLFEQYGVQLVLAGHDHDYQRSEPINDVTYVVSGAAAKLRSAGFDEFTEVALSRLHFLDVTASSDRLTVRAVDQEGLLIDSFVLDPSGQRL